MSSKSPSKTHPITHHISLLFNNNCTIYDTKYKSSKNSKTVKCLKGLCPLMSFLHILTTRSIASWLAEQFSQGDHFVENSIIEEKLQTRNVGHLDTTLSYSRPPITKDNQPTATISFQMSKDSQSQSIRTIKIPKIFRNWQTIE